MIRTFSFKKGEIIFREGHSSDFAYIIESGKFKVSKTFEDGKVRVISILKTNDIFGEMGVIEEMPRSATVTALENGRVTILDKKSSYLPDPRPALRSPRTCRLHCFR